MFIDRALDRVFAAPEERNVAAPKDGLHIPLLRSFGHQ